MSAWYAINDFYILKKAKLTNKHIQKFQPIVLRIFRNLIRLSTRSYMFRNFRQYFNVLFHFQEPWLYDIESNMAVVTEALNDLNERLTKCMNKANEYKSYQKQFRVSNTTISVRVKVEICQ